MEMILRTFFGPRDGGTMQVHPDAITQSRSTDRCERGHQRAILSVPIKVRMLMPGSGVRTTHGVSLDISEGGLGALVESSLRIGDTVGIDLSLPEFDLSAAGVVRHYSSLHSGFEFIGLMQHEREYIAKLVGNG